MTDYSKMSYEELFKIANNDSIAGSLSEEEYESLPVELWRKFSVEKQVGVHADSFVIAPGQKKPNAIRSILNTLRLGFSRHTQTENSPSEISPLSSPEQPSLSRSGD